MTSLPNRPSGSNTINPFVITDNAAGIIEFLTEVFGAVDVPDARTLDSDGLILHAELRIGDSLISIADRKVDWPFTPGFIQIYVDDVESTLDSASRQGATIVTRPTDFFGDTFARVADPSGNIWWVYRHVPQDNDWGAGSDGLNAAEGTAQWSQPGEPTAETDWSSYTSPELEYIHASLVRAMSELKDPRTP